MSQKTLTRRGILLSAGGASLATMMSGSRGAETAVPTATTPQPPRDYKYRNDPDQTNLFKWAALHEGKGAVDVKLFFRETGKIKKTSSAPALLLLYTIPPGASEGVHTHMPGDEKLGSFDEFYYILSGSGEMQIEGEKVPVKPGDHVFTPNGVAHGIENTAAEGDLKVYLVAMTRD